MKYVFATILLSFYCVFCSCEEGGILIEPDISGRNVIIVAPTNNAEIASSVVYFDWEPVEDATAYELQVATPNFENAAQLVLNTEDSLTVAELELTLGNYEWRVRAKNSGYETAYTYASFKVVPVVDFSDNTLLLNNPPNNLITNVLEQTLDWQPIEGTTLYRIQILESGTVVEEQATTATSINITFAEGNYTWQVRAENGLENTLYSSRDILIDTTAPATPQLMAPSDGEEVTSSDVTFEWAREQLEGSVETDSIYVYSDASLLDLVVKNAATSPHIESLENNLYYWFVKAYDEAGNEGPSSSVFTVTVNE